MKCKRLMFCLIMTLLILPFFVNAKEYCTVVSGNGKDIGSEIDCIGEHFYIIDNDDYNVRMLAKYNLNYGSVYDKVTVSDERFNELRATYCESYSQYCDYLWNWRSGDMIATEPEFANYRDYDIYITNNTAGNNSFILMSTSSYDLKTIKVSNERFDEIYSNFCGNTPEDGCDNNYEYAYSQPEFEYGDIINYQDDEKNEFYVYPAIKQDSRYIGAHGDKNDRDYPEYGVIGISSLIYFHREEIEAPYFDGHFYDGRLNTDNLDGQYLNYFDYSGIEMDKFDFITVRDLDDIVYKVTGNHLPLQEWLSKEYEEFTSFSGEKYYVVGSIKDILPEEMKWLYATTYWTKTASSNPQLVYFVDTLGDLCNSDYCYSSVGAGIRPVLTMSRENIKYNIKTETDNNGTIEVVTDSLAGEEISFVLKSKEGYRLRSLTLRTESGIEVEFTEISNNTNGTIIVNTNKFMMPMENVKITANWEKEEDSTPEEKETSNEYSIKTVVDGDGSIEVAEKSAAGENIEFTVKTLNGSKLVSLQIKSQDGRNIDYTKVREEDGSTTIIVNKFAMPEDDITIMAKFETIVPVPKTGDNIMRYITIFVISLIILISLVFVAIKNNKKTRMN